MSQEPETVTMEYAGRSVALTQETRAKADSDYAQAMIRPARLVFWPPVETESAAVEGR
jgi:hypothetical protein